MSLAGHQTVAEAATVAPVLRPALQRACACGAERGVEDQCPACAAKARLGAQPKLTVNHPGDRWEQEADRIADRVVAAGSPGPVAAAGATLQREPMMEEEEEELQMKPAGIQRQGMEKEEELQMTPAGLQREEMEEEEELQMKPAGLQRMGEEEEELQMSGAGPSSSGAAVTRAGETVVAGGQPLTRAERGYFEPRLGRDLSSVRLHDDARAGAAARGINARAYTLRNHIAFAPGARDFGSTVGRRLMAHEFVHTLQQGNGPIGLQREAAPPAKTETVDTGDMSDKAKEREKIDAAFFFAGGDYGTSARRYIKTFYPNHLLFSARSFEAMFSKLFRVLEAARSPGNNPHLRELIIVSHGNAAGGLEIPLVEGKKENFNLWTLSELQQDFRSELHEEYRRRRSAVVSDLVDSRTKVIVRACEFGQSPDALAALRDFLGGAPEIWAPKGIQGFEAVNIGDRRNDLLSTPEEAFDFLTKVDFLPKHLSPLAEEDKREYIARVFGLRGTVPSVFFVMSNEDYKEIKKLGKIKRDRTKSAERLKHREEAGEPSHERARAGEYWAVSSRASRVPDPDLLGLGIDEIEARAWALVKNYKPENAYKILLLEDEWYRKTMRARDYFQNDHFLEGIAPWMQYSDNKHKVYRDAERFPGPIDPFETETIVPPEGEPSDEYREGIGSSGGAAGARRGSSETEPGPPDGGTSSKSQAASGRAAAEDFSKSEDFEKINDSTEPEALDIDAIIELLSRDVDPRTARELLEKLPKKGWSTSDYLSAIELPTMAISGAVMFVEAEAMILIEGAGAIFLLPIFQFAGAYYSLSATSEFWERASTALGIEIGYERLSGALKGDEVPFEYDADAYKGGLDSDARVQIHIIHNQPFYGLHVVEHVEKGIDIVFHDANVVIETATKKLAEVFGNSGLSGEKIDIAIRASRDRIVSRILHETIRIGRGQLEYWRNKTQEKE